MYLVEHFVFFSFILHFKSFVPGIKIMTMIKLYQIVQQHENPTFDEKLDFFESTLLNNFVLILY